MGEDLDDEVAAAAPGGSGAPGDGEHTEIRAALDEIEEALDDAAATIARMG